MEVVYPDIRNILPGDPKLIEIIVNHLKSQGIFDQFRKECLADVDTKPAYQNLRQRVEGSVGKFLSGITWKADLNKNQLRDNVRREVNDCGMLSMGVDRIVDQIVTAKISQVFLPKITSVVHELLGIEQLPKTNEADKSADANPSPRVASAEVGKPSGSGSAPSNSEVGRTLASSPNHKHMEMTGTSVGCNSPDLNKSQDRDKKHILDGDKKDLKQEESLMVVKEAEKQEIIPKVERTTSAVEVTKDQVCKPEEQQINKERQTRPTKVERLPNAGEVTKDIVLKSEDQINKDKQTKPTKVEKMCNADVTKDLAHKPEDHVNKDKQVRPTKVERPSSTSEVDKDQGHKLEEQQVAKEKQPKLSKVDKLSHVNEITKEVVHKLEDQVSKDKQTRPAKVEKIHATVANKDLIHKSEDQQISRDKQIKSESKKGDTPRKDNDKQSNPEMKKRDTPRKEVDNKSSPDIKKGDTPQKDCDVSKKADGKASEIGKQTSVDGKSKTEHGRKDPSSLKVKEGSALKDGKTAEEETAKFSESTSRQKTPSDKSRSDSTKKPEGKIKESSSGKVIEKVEAKIEKSIKKVKHVEGKDKLDKPKVVDIGKMDINVKAKLKDTKEKIKSRDNVTKSEKTSEVKKSDKGGKVVPSKNVSPDGSCKTEKNLEEKKKREHSSKDEINKEKGKTEKDKSVKIVEKFKAKITADGAKPDVEKSKGKSKDEDVKPDVEKSKGKSKGDAKPDMEKSKGKTKGDDPKSEKNKQDKQPTDCRKGKHEQDTAGIKKEESKHSPKSNKPSTSFKGELEKLSSRVDEHTSHEKDPSKGEVKNSSGTSSKMTKQLSVKESDKIKPSKSSEHRKSDKHKEVKNKGESHEQQKKAGTLKEKNKPVVIHSQSKEVLEPAETHKVFIASGMSPIDNEMGRSVDPKENRNCSPVGWKSVHVDKSPLNVQDDLSDIDVTPGSSPKWESSPVHKYKISRKLSDEFERDVDYSFETKAAMNSSFGNESITSTDSKDRSWSDENVAYAMKKRRWKEQDDDDDDDGALSDVTVSSVHTSDLSDYDDRITLTDIEEDSPKKSASHGSENQLPQGAKCRPRSRTPRPDQDEHGECEPRRELRRQRKLNPRYASDDFSSIFTKHRDKGGGGSGHLNLDASPSETNAIHHDSDRGEFLTSKHGRDLTCHTSEELNQPLSPYSDVSETQDGKRRRGNRGQALSPFDISRDLSRARQPRTQSTETNESTETRRRTSSASMGSSRGSKRDRSADHQRYDNSDLYKPRPIIHSSRRSRGTSPPSGGVPLSTCVATGEQSSGRRRYSLDAQHPSRLSTSSAGDDDSRNFELDDKLTSSRSRKSQSEEGTEEVKEGLVAVRGRPRKYSQDNQPSVMRGAKRQVDWPSTSHAKRRF